MERDQYITRLQDALQNEREKVRRNIKCVHVYMLYTRTNHIDVGHIFVL